MKGLKLKKTIFIRISVSKEKDLKSKNKLKLEKEDEKEKSKSVNKNEIKTFKTNMKFNENNTKNKKINDKINGMPKIDNKNINIININNNKLENYEVAKKIKNYKEKDKEQPNKNINKKSKLDNANNNINNLSKNYKNNEKSAEKAIPKAKINPEDKSKNIYPIKNLNVRFIDAKESSKKKQLNNITNNKQIEPNKSIIPNKKDSDSSSIPQIKYNNVNIIFTSSSKKKKDNIPINNLNKNDILNDNKNQNNTEIAKDKNNKNKSNVKAPNYNKKIYSALPTKVVHTELSERGGKINQYNPYESKKFINNKGKISDNSKSSMNKTDNNIYKRNTYQNKKVMDKSNENNINGKYNIRNKNNTYSQKTTKPSLKGGVTTVIQHYSGSRKKYENYKK